MSTASNLPTPLRSVFADDADMAELVQQFVAEMPERLSKLEQLWSAQALEDLRRYAHQLKGSGGGYGFPSVSEAASELEAALEGLSRGRQEATTQHLRGAYEQLTGVCKRVQC